MKTIEIIRFTGEIEEITVDEVTTEVPVFVVTKEYECQDGEENSLLSRARLTAELWTRDKEGEYTARIQE